MNQKFTARAETTVQASPAMVWAALTQPELIQQYLFGSHVQTDWKEGSPITYSGVWEGKTYQDKGKILKFVPEKLLESTFWSALAGQPDQPEFYKTVRYELIPEGSATRLVVTQDNNATPEEADHSSKNWEMVLDGLKKILEG